MSEITARINQRLKEMGISKEEFYKQCKITSAAYSQWNTEKTEPKPASLKRVSDFLNVNYQWLQFGTGEKEKPTTQQGVELSKTKYDLLTPENKMAIDLLIERLLASQSPE